MKGWYTTIVAGACAQAFGTPQAASDLIQGGQGTVTDPAH